MSYVKVDYSQLASTASVIDEYVSTMKTEMTNANTEVAGLSSKWSGEDYTQFKSQWDTVDNSDSTHAQMISALESYSNYLNYAAGKYKTAQSSALTRAASLPKY